MKNNYYNDQTNQAYNTFYNSFHSLPTGGDRGDGKPVTTIKVNNGEFEKLDSQYIHFPYFTLDKSKCLKIMMQQREELVKENMNMLKDSNIEINSGEPNF